MIILVEINVKGFLWKCAAKTSIFGQNHKVANSETYWTLLTKQKLSFVIQLTIMAFKHGVTCSNIHSSRCSMIIKKLQTVFK